MNFNSIINYKVNRNQFPSTKKFDSNKINNIMDSFRSWNPFESSLSAAIISGLEIIPINKTSSLLYIGHLNYDVSLNLLDLVENNPNCSVKTIKSVALNILFIKAIEVFLKDESNNIDSTVRYLDKYLKDIEDIGVFSGIIKK